MDRIQYRETSNSGMEEAYRHERASRAFRGLFNIESEAGKGTNPRVSWPFA